MFLKYLDDLERANERKAELQGKKYNYIIDKPHRWSAWAAPKKKDGSFDHDKALTGDDLIKYVDEELFPYLKGFRTRAEGANTVEYKIGEIFSEIENKFRSGYSLRDALELVDGLSFRSQQEKHELSHLYEAKLRNMGNAGRNGGEYYTPRPLIRAMIHVVKPKIGERIYDGACGSAGFLCESFEYMTKDRDKLSTKDMRTLQEKTFYGKEKKSLAYVIGIMNMILHGIDAPNIVHINTLTENISDIQIKDRFDVVLANPPFGGKERQEVQQNFPIKTGETAFLFLQHFIKSLKAGGRAGIVIKNTFLSNTDNASVALRKELLENCNLHTVLDMPSGTFQGAGVKTVVLFFEKGSATRNDGIDLENMDFIPRERFDLLSNGKIKRGDILFCLRGSLGKFGSVGKLPEGAIASSLVIVRAAEAVTQDFLLLYFGSHICADMIGKFSNGAAQPNLSARSLGNFEIPVPPEGDQMRIVKQCRDLKEHTKALAENYRTKLDEISYLKQSILQKAFSGELTLRPSGANKEAAE